MVKSVKRLIKKCTRSNEDFLKGLMILRNSPLACGKSPSELMFNRILRDNLPTIPQITDRKYMHRFESERVSQNYQLSKEQQVFDIGQPVAMQDHVTKESTWRGRIHQYVAPRSYKVKLSNGTILRRNQQALRKLYVFASSPQVHDPKPPSSPNEQDGYISSSDVSRSTTSTVPYYGSDGCESSDKVRSTTSTIPYYGSDTNDEASGDEENDDHHNRQREESTSKRGRKRKIKKSPHFEYYM